MTTLSDNIIEEKRTDVNFEPPNHKKYIIKQIVDEIGIPKNLIKFTVTKVTTRSYRINCYVNPDDPRIASSWFVLTDNDGNILSSNPKICKPL